MKQIAFLDYSHVFAGAERVLYNVIAHIDRSKYKPFLIFPYPMGHQKRYNSLDCEKLYLANGLKWWMGSNRWRHPIKGSDFFKRSIFGNKIAEIVKKKGIDILDVNLIRSDVKMWIWATKKQTEAKIVGHYRSQSQEWVPPANAQRLFDSIACVSEFSRMRFRLKGDFTNTSVLYDSVDIDLMKSTLSKSDAKEKLGYDKNIILLTSVGQLSMHKGHDTAIKAFSQILSEYPQSRLLIAGGGSVELIKYYHDLASALGISDKVQIPGKQLGNIQDVYRATDLTLSLTKVGEGFGLVPYESTLLNTPFIAPYFGAVCEFVNDNDTGYLVDTNDLNAVVSKIRYAISHPDETKNMIQRLQQIIYNKLSPQVLARNLDKLYSSL